MANRRPCSPSACANSGPGRDEVAAVRDLPSGQAPIQFARVTAVVKHSEDLNELQLFEHPKPEVVAILAQALMTHVRANLSTKHRVLADEASRGVEVIKERGGVLGMVLAEPEHDSVSISSRIGMQLDGEGHAACPRLRPRTSRSSSSNDTESGLGVDPIRAKRSSTTVRTSSGTSS